MSFGKIIYRLTDKKIPSTTGICLAGDIIDTAYYRTVLHQKKGFPSAATLRQRMDKIGKTHCEQVLDFNDQLLRSNYVDPIALKNGMIPLDMDVTPMDNSKTQKEQVINL